MSIASEITRLQGVKSDILQAISDKGVDVPAGSALDDCPGLIASISGGGGDQFVLVRSNMTTDFTNAEYQACVNAVTAGKAVCVQFERDSRTFQAQLTQVTDRGTLVFEFTAENRHYRWEVDFTSDSHTITSKTLKFSVAEPEDWIDITDEWAFVNDFRLSYNGETPGAGNAMTVLYSPARKIVKFTGGMRINKSSSWNDSEWKRFLQYRGNRFYSSHNAPSFDLAPKVYPRPIGGMAFIPATNSGGRSISALCKLSYTGSPGDSSEICALAMQLFLPANTTIYGAIMEGLQLSVTPIP